MLPIKLQIPADFLDEETRCEYLVSTKIKKIWAIELDLLNEFLSFCKENDIAVVAWAGTLLGAIRHKGFIPWDDDADVAMTRDNFEKLLKLVTNETFQSPYFFQTAYNDRKFFFGYARFRNSETTGHIIGNDALCYNNGIYIDVFVLDGYGSTSKEQFMHKRDRDIYAHLIHCSYANYTSSSYVKNIIKKILGFFLKGKCIQNRLIHKYHAIMSRYRYSKRIGLFTHPDYFIKRYWCSPEDLKNIIYVDFEFLKIPIPENYDEILTHMYGKYMEFPPVEKRGCWHDNIIYFDPDIPYITYMKKKLGLE